jgi:short-subunit dehydrogenase
LDFKGKVAIVTGSSSGIGLGTARLLSSKGARCALVARSKNRLEEISKELGESVVVPTDISKIFEVRRMVEKVANYFGSIDILVNNAGVGYDAFVEKIDVDTFHYVFDLDLVGPVVAMQQVIPYMRKQGGGTIMNVSSAVALMNLPNNAP